MTDTGVCSTRITAATAANFEFRRCGKGRVSKVRRRRVLPISASSNDLRRTFEAASTASPAHVHGSLKFQTIALRSGSPIVAVGDREPSGDDDRQLDRKLHRARPVRGWQSALNESSSLAEDRWIGAARKRRHLHPRAGRKCPSAGADLRHSTRPPRNDWCSVRTGVPA